MAVEEGFSIRGYTAKMRTVDFKKCWPFDGVDGKRGETPAPSLPPISVRTFRWWHHDPEAEQPEGSGHGEPDLENIAQTGDELVPVASEARNPAKGKQRPPKKRSIVELFAAAPQVEALEEETDEDDEGEEELGRDAEVGGQRQEGEKERVEDLPQAGDVAAPEAPRKLREQIKGNKKREMWSKKVLMNYKKSNKRKKKRPKVEICAAKKEKIQKAKISCAVHISHLLQGSVSKRFGKTHIGPVDAQKKKQPTMKSSSKKRSFKFTQSSKLPSENQEVAKDFPAHSILKNQTRASSTRKTSFKGDAQGDNLIKPRFKSKKHVTFSGKDDVLGYNKSCSPMDLPQLKNFCKILSKELVALSTMKDSSNSDKLPPTIERDQVSKESANADSSVASVAESTIKSLSENKQSIDDPYRAAFPIEIDDRNYPDTEKTSLSGTLDLNSAIQSFAKLNCSNSSGSALSQKKSYSGNSQVLSSTYIEGLDSNEEFQAEESNVGYEAEEISLRTTNARSLPVAMGVPRSGPTSTETITRSLVPRSPATCSIANKQSNESGPRLSVVAEIDSFMQSPEYQSGYNLSSRDIFTSIGSLVRTKKHAELTPAPDSLSIGRDKHIAEGFIGLPLNSQGELINSHSSGKFALNGHFKKQNLWFDSESSFPVHNIADPKNRMDQTNIREKFPSIQDNQLKWFPDPAKETVISSFGITEMQDFRGIQVQNLEAVRDTDPSLQQDPNPFRACHGCREYAQSHNWTDREKFGAQRNMDNWTQPAMQTTMRLMGKDVTVGERSKACQGFDDGKIWTDKEIIAEQCSEPFRMPWPQREQVEHPPSGISKENHLKQSEALSRFYHIPTADPRFDHSCFDRRPQWMSSSSLFSTIGNHGSNLNRSYHPFPLNPFQSNTFKSMVNCNSLTKSVEMANQIPVMASHPQNVSQQMFLNSTHCKHSQSHSYSRPSTFCYPFPNHDNGNSVEPLPAQTSSYLPQWLLNAKQEKHQKNYFPPNTDPHPIAVCHPCTIHGNNLLPFPSPYPTSIVPPLYSNHDSQRCSLSTPSSVIHPSFIPPYPVRKTTTTFNPVDGDKIKIRDGRESNFKYFKLPDRSNITKKRPARGGDDFMRQGKKPNLAMHGNSNAIGPRQKEQFPGCLPCSTRYPETPAYGNKVMGADIVTISDEKCGSRTAPRSNSLKLDGRSKSGPVKLSAGAKHILKPSQNIDQDSSRPIHATIPFAVGTRPGMNSISLKNAAKIYRF